MNSKIEIRNKVLSLRTIIRKIDQLPGTLYKDLDFLDNDMADTGIYVIKDENNKVVYVGKGDCQTLTRRLSECISNDRKFGSIAKKVKNSKNFDNYNQSRDYVKNSWSVIIVPFQRHSVDGEVMTDKLSPIRGLIRNIEDRLINHYQPVYNIRRSRRYLNEGFNTRLY